jgi:hypothetical protein
MDCKLHQDNTDTRGAAKSSLKHTSGEIKPDQSEDGPLHHHNLDSQASGASGADESLAHLTCREQGNTFFKYGQG